MVYIDPLGNAFNDISGEAEIYLNDGNDTVDAVNVAAFVYGGSGTDNLFYSGIGIGHLYGGADNDSIAGGNQRDFLYGEDGNDRIEDPGGFNLIDSGPGRDYVVLLSNASAVIYGGSDQDALNGGTARDVIYGGDGNDRGYFGLGLSVARAGLFGKEGNDFLDGGRGNDLLIGGLGRDVSIGGLGADNFRFESLSESLRGTGRDIVQDFRHGQRDHIDLSLIDVVPNTLQEDNFRFIGTESFRDYHLDHPNSDAVLLRFDPNSHMLQGDTHQNYRIDGQDFEVKLVGLDDLVRGDLIL